MPVQMLFKKSLKVNKGGGINAFGCNAESETALSDTKVLGYTSRIFAGC
jgi:hypothetical protein